MQLGISDFYYDTDSVVPVAVRYRRFQEAGFSCIDFNTARTDTPFYTTAPRELEKFMSWLLEYAKQLDITVCLENMPHRNFSMAKPEKVLELVTLLDDPHFQMCLDTGHVATQEGLDLAEQVHMIGKHLKALHVHDNGGEKDEHRYPGKGVINWKSFACALKDVGFDGVFSLETAPADEWPEPELVKELDVLSGIAREIVSQIEQ